MNTLNIITALLSLCFIVLFVRTFSKKSLKSLFLNVKTRATIDESRKKAVEEGKIPFYFERGNVVIYAKTQARAIYDYRQMKLTQKREKNVVRK